MMDLSGYRPVKKIGKKKCMVSCSETISKIVLFELREILT